MDGDADALADQLLAVEDSVFSISSWQRPGASHPSLPSRTPRVSELDRRVQFNQGEDAERYGEEGGRYGEGSDDWSEGAAEREAAEGGGGDQEGKGEIEGGGGEGEEAERYDKEAERYEKGGVEGGGGEGEAEEEDTGPVVRSRFNPFARKASLHTEDASDGSDGSLFLRRPLDATKAWRAAVERVKQEAQETRLRLLKRNLHSGLDPDVL